MSFVHLHTHSHYSLLDGLAKIDELVKRAAELKMPALALTDHGSMYGAIEFYQKCTKAGVKPIIGVEAYLAPNGLDKKRARIDENRYHLILLAKNETGYKNLIKLTTLAHLKGYYYKPRIDWSVLSEYKEGLIGLSACLMGEIPRLIISGNIKEARETALKYSNLFGKENFYLEVQHHPLILHQEQANKKIYELGKELGIDVVATNDIHYLNREDAEAQDTLLCIQTNRKIDDTNRMSMIGDDFYFQSADEMKEHFKEHPEVIENTLKVAEGCSLKIDFGKITLPYFEVPSGHDPDSFLKELAVSGLKNRYNIDHQHPTPQDKELLDRFEYELSIIKKTGFASYFLIVQDFVNWAKNNGIKVGPGRGSAAGSIISYLTNITNIDPIKYNLLFERFLNPERISMPDIDLDFSDIRRDEVIKYVESKYGKNNVAQIITFGTMAARAAVRDAGRALGLNYTYCDHVAKMIPSFTTLGEALTASAELKDLYSTDEECKKLIDRAKKLEGVARHTSTHACGVLITKEALENYVPLQYASSSDESVVSQYSLHPIEDLGLLKMDFLGLKNLTILENAIDVVEKVRGVKIDLDNIPLDDKKTFELLQKGETTGVFQLESSGMKRYLIQLKPNEFEDIIAMVSLYRPGPIEWIPDYIAGKHKKKVITYLHPKLQPILEKTYGVAIYQEQILQIARDLAGFTLGEADVLRKAVGKKIPELLAEQKAKFVTGCIKNGISKKTAENIFEFIEPFAGYGFNRAHGTCYAMIAYETAYLKANFPLEFMASLLTSEGGDTERIAIEVEECRKMGIEVLPPDINESYSTFTVVAVTINSNKPRIRFGLTAIKNLGENIIKAIIHERKANGAYSDLENFLERVQHKDLNKKSLESLIKSGTLEKFGERNQLLENLEQLLAFNKAGQKEKESGQKNLFALTPAMTAKASLKLAFSAPASKKQKLLWEKELLGLYVSDHPLRDFEGALQEKAFPLLKLKELPPNTQVDVAGIITKAKKIITKSGGVMLFIQLEDVAGTVEVLVFPKVLKDNPSLWEEDKVVLVSGKVSDKDGVPKILADSAQEITLENIKDLHPKHPISRRVCLNLDYPVEEELTAKLKKIFLENPGTYKVLVNVISKTTAKKIETKYKINCDTRVKELLEEIVGAGAVFVSEI